MNIYLLKKEINEKKKKMAFPNKSKIIYEKVLLENDFFTQNNIFIQKKLKKIDYYYYFFHCFHVISNGILESKIKSFENLKNYIFIDIIKFNKDTLPDYLNQWKYNKKLYIQNLVIIYKNLLSSLLLVNKIGICYFNWNENNIFIKENGETLLSNFEYSIDYSVEFLEEYWNKIINIVQKKLLPIEVWFLYYLNKYKFKSSHISSSLLDDIFIIIKEKDQTILNISYEEYISLFQLYINKTIQETIISLSTFINTWDNYGLSKIFLHLLEKFIQDNPYDTKYPFLPKWHLLLKKNISFNPVKRESLLKTQLEFENILSTF
jgi:hypothetical protein